MKETESSSNSDFAIYFKRFLDNQEDIQSLSECVRILKEKDDIRKLPIPSTSVADSTHSWLIAFMYMQHTFHPKRLKPLL